jgi:ribosomal protein L19
VDDPKVARVLKLEASNVAEAQKAIEHFQPGDYVSTPVVVTEAQWKES